MLRPPLAPRLSFFALSLNIFMMHISVLSAAAHNYCDCFSSCICRFMFYSLSPLGFSQKSINLFDWFIFRLNFHISMHIEVFKRTTKKIVKTTTTKMKHKKATIV